MNFAKAMELMKQGVKVKLPTWNGYWAWDAEKRTIMMHCRGGAVIDIRETERVEYTAGNIASDEWIVADETNCPELGGEALFGFDNAIRYVKRGLRIARKGWNGKGQYVELADCISYKNNAGEVVNAEHEAIGNKALAFVGTSGVQLGWLASQSDMLAEDWMFV